MRIFSARSPEPIWERRSRPRPLALLELALEQAGAQDLERALAVLDLRALVLAGHDEPVGRCVMRTAESVVLTTGRRARGAVDVDLDSLGSSSTSTSSASGSTATVAVEVWMRPWVSVCGTRCTRCTPDSHLNTE